MLSLIFSLFSLTLFCFLNNWFFYIVSLFFFFFVFFVFFNGFDYFSFVSYYFMLDSISFLFCCLSIWLFIIVFISSFMFYYLDSLSNFFIFCFHSLLLFLILDFIVVDFFYFYFFFECSLVPLILMIFGWGYQPERLGAGFFLIFYTLFGSLPFLLSIFFLNMSLGYFNYLFYDFISSNYLMFFILFSFLVKFPFFGFHIWLPSAHVEAPTFGSMILAGVMLKLGGYGFIRCSFYIYYFLFNYSYFFVSVCLFGCLYISLICMIQSDLSILVAYSSVCHMSLVICGLFSLTSLGLVGSLSFMIAHGFVSSGLFFLIGMVYDRLGSRSFFIVKGLLNYLPSLSMFWFFFCVMNMSCPPSLNLFSEICLVISVLSWSFSTFFFFSFILFFSACYSIMIFSLTQHGLFSSDMVLVSTCYVREYFVLILHCLPIFFLMLDLSFFFL
uniref:NADH-ubiquinone oxidoreductase chain 4 n=1 Tax=Pyrops lathburii TaxID=2873974 RepID=A0A9E8G9Y7_9HEMI|nr:NADH dehydrogenase subunit 4 [Pyrops lathburii]UAT98612.1 NADH dehydrogenase subunit 4 [Pyrops lathburii]UZT27059.1 NADH dehydrogenase subunit 4 [Pyrops lathburii]